MKKTFTLTLILSSCLLFAWGKTGHRVVGEVAQQHIKKSTQRKINRLLNGQGLASASNFADEIKSDQKYHQFFPWHYVNFPNNQEYESGKANPKGDLIYAIQYCIDVLEESKESKKNKSFYLKMLVHFVGDLHMPLHVGQAENRGGNDIKVKWFGKDSNLHRVWDEDMISSYAMSYTELCLDLPQKNKKEIKNIQKGTFLDWAYESKTYSNEVYASAKKGDKLGYKYQYDNFDLVKNQLQKGGLRLAKILDEVLRQVKI